MKLKAPAGKPAGFTVFSKQFQFQIKDETKAVRIEATKAYT
jgi:hypothetical protein